MSTLTYKDGFNYAFNADACSTCNGRCCTGESGNIFLNSQEISAIALHLKLPTEKFIDTYLKKVGFKYSIKEHIVGMSHDCIFYDRKISGCSIYEVRPSQCVTFPFWDYFKSHLAELRQECPGIVDV